MKAFFLVFVTLILLSSCGEITEEITIEADGSGRYEISSDMIPMMRQMMGGFAAFGTSDDEQSDSAAIAKKVEEMIWKDFPDEIDSVFTFDEKIPDDIKNNPAKMKVLEKAQMFMRGGKKTGKMLTGLEYDFDKASDFVEFYGLFEESNNASSETGISELKTALEVTDKTFFRSTVVESVTAQDSPEGKMTMAMMKDFNVRTVLHFSKRIKKVELKNYTIIEQKDKSIWLKYNPEAAMTKGAVSEIKVELK